MSQSSVITSDKPASALRFSLLTTMPNLVVLGALTSRTKTKNSILEAVVHEREVLKGIKTPEELYDKEIVELVEARISEEIGYEKYR
jgi:hypothetical protein